MAGKDILIGVDAGTSVIKAVAFTTSGTQIAIASRRNVTLSPMPGAVEQDMARTWADCAASLRDLAGQVPNLAARVLALGVTAQGDGTWLIDAEGEPVHNGWLWLDSRAASIANEALAARTYPAHYALTGTGINACMQSIQLSWIKRHQPEIIARATTAFHCKDWLYFKLTGDRVTDPSEANYTFGSYSTRAYQENLIDALGLSDCRRLLPRIVDGTQEAGALSAKAAQETGLPQGLPVSLGFLDVVCSALGGGLYDPTGQVGVSILGSTGMHMRFTPRAADVTLNDSMTGYTMAFPVPGAVSQMQSNMATTLNIDWLLEIAGQATVLSGGTADRAKLLQGMDAAVLAAAPGSALYHPYIVEAGERGPFLNPDARAQFSGLSTRTSFAGLMRGLYEGLAFAARDCYATMGPIPKEVRVAGGAARSRAVRAILASVLGAEVRTVSREETGAAGAVMIAAVNLGLYPDMQSCCDAWVTPELGEAIHPDPALVEHYNRQFEVYRTIRQVMVEPWRQMAALQRTTERQRG
jgi:erythritol kinase (D-erythritol 1-phosphate-forming)